MRLGKLVKIKHGFAFKGEHFSDSGDYILLTPGNIYPRGGLKLKGDKETFYTGDIPQGYVLAKGDLVVVMTDLTQHASILGGAMFIDKSDLYLHNQRLGLVSHTNEIDRRFLYQYFNWQFFRDQVKASSNGATVKHTSPSRIYQCRIFRPPVPTQRKIAAVLSAYDELIENNQRCIALLETLAQEIYREWFVRLRFPGHEKVKFVKGIPEDWEVKRISEIVDFLSGYSFKSETYTSSGRFGIVTIKNVQEGFFIPECSDFIEEPPSNMKQHCVLRAGDVLMSLTGNVGRVCHVFGSSLLLNQRVAKLRPKLANSSQFVYYTFNNRSMIQLIENLSLGSTAQMNLSPILLGKQKLVVPNSRLLEEFESTVRPFTEQKVIFYRQCESLRRCRDLLLPRLISGKLSVENLDIQFPPGMAEKWSIE